MKLRSAPLRKTQETLKSKGHPAWAGSSFDRSAKNSAAAAITGENLTGILAERVMLWRARPDRFLKGRREWTPRWRFQPLRRLEDALQLLEKANGTYSFTKNRAGVFTAQVAVGSQTGIASGKSKPATVTVALARAIGIDVPNELVEACGG